MGIQNLAGQTLGQYELHELLGVGGMGAVYRARQRSLKRYVAVKVMSAQLAEQPDYISRFMREAETSAALEHPHIVPVHDYGAQATTLYVVMRLLTGGSLDERVAQRRDSAQPLPSLGEVADLLRQIGGALDYAHSQGVIHRDIKLSNVMFDNQGNAYLVDFGIAKLMQETSGLTASGAVIGTWGYMAPEQWRAENLAPATDQYALGVMIYALVTGHMPFDAPTPAGIMHKHLNEMPTPPHAYRPSLPEAVEQVLARAMAKKAQDRFPTCTAFAQAFDAAIRGSTGEVTNYFTTSLKRRTAPTSGRPISAPAYPPTSTRPVYRHPAMWAMSAALLVATLVIALLLFGGGGKEPTPAATTSAPGVAVQGTGTATLTPTLTVEPSATAARSPTPKHTATPTLTHTPTDTATYTPTATLTPTLSDTEKEATIQAEIAAMLTLTAAHWTPTENLAATAQSRLEQTQTQQASDWILTQTQMALDLTATVDAWTDTPTTTATDTPTNTPTPTLTATFTPEPTKTPMPTAAITLDPLQTALERAQNFSGSNTDWEPFVQTFDGVEMVLVPAGCFMMGSADNEIAALVSQTGSDWYENERPQHRVCFEEPFWIDRTEVTNGQFAAFNGQAADIPAFFGSDRPRERITWTEAQLFCANRGARLPTEAEWEYAARGPDALLYPWGSHFASDNLVWSEKPGTVTAGVGSKPLGVSWVGALDMSGNVWEWVTDWYDIAYYGTLADGAVNPPGPASGGGRVLRGGAWDNYDAADFRTAFRFRLNPDTTLGNLGFRCARSR